MYYVRGAFKFGNFIPVLKFCIGSSGKWLIFYRKLYIEIIYSSRSLSSILYTVQHMHACNVLISYKIIIENNLTIIMIQYSNHKCQLTNNYNNLYIHSQFFQVNFGFTIV